MPVPHEIGMFLLSTCVSTGKSLSNQLPKGYYRNIPANPREVTTSPDLVRVEGRSPTAPRLVIGVIGHQVSPMEVGREHEGDVHDPVDDGLGLRSKLHRPDIKRVTRLIIT